MEKILDIKSIDQVSILGIGDCNLKLVQSEIPVRITIRKEKLKIIGEKDDVNQACQIFIEMIETVMERYTSTFKTVNDDIESYDFREITVTDMVQWNSIPARTQPADAED